MISPVYTPPSWKKSTLSLNIGKINSSCPKKIKKQQVDEDWIDLLIPGDSYAVCLKKGNRPYMQDCYTAFSPPSLNPPTRCFGVFDGHSGIQAAQYASEHLLENISSLSFAAISSAFRATDLNYQASSPLLVDGTTACIACISSNRLIVANVGDTRALLVKKCGVEQLTYDHLASDPAERERIENAGGYVLPVGNVHRVQGKMMLSRSIGDLPYKDLLISEPHIIEKQLSTDDLMLVLATDGLFESLSNDAVGQIVRENSNMNMSSMVELLCDLAIAKGSRDNVTALVVDLRKIDVQNKGGYSINVESEEDSAYTPPFTPRNIHNCKFHF